MSIDDGELTQLDAKIRSLAEAYLATGRPYLLSRLGKDLGDDLKRVKIGYGRSLGEYVSERLADEYSVILMGEHRNIQALVPVSRPFPGIAPEKSTTADERRSPRYNYRFWAAFSVPLAEGSRWLNVDDFTFKDIKEKPEGNDLEIPSSLVAPEEAENRDALIKSNIATWLESNGLTQDRFIAKAAFDNKNTPAVGGKSLLDAVVQALDRRQLASTTLSLDVVAELLRRRV